MITNLISSTILVIVFSAVQIFTQVLPKSYSIGEELKLQKQLSNENPQSNFISDIITNNAEVWLGTSRGVSHSTDRGESWENFFGTSSFGTESISAIALDPYTNAVWAATAHSVDKDGQSLPEGSGLKYSLDNGLTWQSIAQPIDNASDSSVTYGINKLRALPVTVAVQNITYDIAFTPGTVWITSFAGGLRKSTDNGQTWQRVPLPPDYLNQIKPTDTLDFCMSPVAGKFCSEGNYNYRAFSVISVNDTTLFVGTADGINKSTDGGLSWRKFNHTNQENPISGNFVVALAYNNFDNTIWAATWKAEGTTEYYAVSFSEDGGENWKTTLSGEKAHNFAFKSFHVIAATDNGPFRSKDNGYSWILPNSIIDSRTKIRLNTNVFYSAGVSGDDVWLGSAEGLVKLVEEGNLFMWNGMWRIYIASSALNSSNETYAFPNPYSPKLDALKIKYSTNGKDSKVSIKIFDFGMNYVRTVVQNVQRGATLHVVDGKESSGANGVIDFWDGRDDAGKIVPNGVYFYRIEIDSGDPLYGKILVLQ